MAGNADGEEGLRDLRVLEEIERDPQVSQRTISQRVGIALGLTNTILRRLVRKGLVTTRSLPANRLAYHLTPKGLADKARLVLDYARTTASFFYNLRLVINRILENLKAERGVKTVAIIGTGELADAVYLSVRELELDLVGVYDTSEERSRWLGMDVLPVPDGPIAADVLIVTRLEGVDGVGEPETRLAQEGAVVVQMRDLIVKNIAYYARAIERETG